MSHETGTGFAHYLIEDGFNKQYLLLGSQFLEEDIDGASPVLLETMDGQTVSVSRNSLSTNYTLLSKIRVANSWTGSSRSIAPVSPVFISYKGFKAALIGVTHKAGLPNSRRFALYQRLSIEQDESRDVYAMPLDEFYDSFSLITETTVTLSPYPIDEKGTIGYITNRGALDKEKYPLMYIVIDHQSKSMLIQR
ncbi:hypothetical protein OTK49_01770 [Vibrio coralliirubri]|uniref:hypothetical protein n=1 Tax=Vibrio coralliirubri TaxID=1516159 RepID=UPI0022833AC4|nr:hypothetical protein [Vibrio coralliirubri]MCY9861241.1 hypothetical protein [Vibrio coralliirubri]